MPLQGILLAAAFAFAALPAGAGVLSTMTGASAPQGGTERKYDVATLRPADLQSCLVDVYTIDSTDALFDAERPKVEQEREALRKLRDAASGKPSGEAAAAQAELRSRTLAFNARIASLNSHVAYATQARERFSRNCKGYRYYFEDLAVVRDRLPVEVREALPKAQ